MCFVTKQINPIDAPYSDSIPYIKEVFCGFQLFRPYRNIFDHYQKKSFTDAAKVLVISQPAVTQHIKLLEKAVETKLFKRSRGTIILTEKGKQFYIVALKIEKAYRQAESKIALRFVKHHSE